MSEPSSLYAKIHISKEGRDKFLESHINNPSYYEDWLLWLNNKEYSGSAITETTLGQVAYNSSLSGQYIQEWMSNPSAFSYELYDESSEIWLLSMYEFSENYLEYISFLNVLRGVDRFVDREGEGYILVHSYVWGDTDSDALVHVSKGNSNIVNTIKDIPHNYVKEASAHFRKREMDLSE